MLNFPCPRLYTNTILNMDVSVDTNILIHLYNAYSKELLLSSFDKVYAYEYIIDAELIGNSKEVYIQVEEDIKRILRRDHKDNSSDRDYYWLKNFCDEHNVDLRSRIVNLVEFVKGL